MKKWWIRSLALSFGLLAGGAQAQEGGWQTPSQTSSNQAGLAGNRADTRTAAPTSNGKNGSASRKPAVTMGKPVVIMSKPVAIQNGISEVIKTNYVEMNAPEIIYRGQNPDGSVSSKMPSATGKNASVVSFNNGQSPILPPQAIQPGTVAGTTPAGPQGTPVNPLANGVISGVPANPAPFQPLGSDTFIDASQGSSCGAIDGACGAGACPGYRFYASADYLLWWVKGSPVPPLLTTTNGLDGPRSGAIGLPGTTVVYGGNSLVNDPRSGARVMAGYWFDDQRIWGFELGGFFLNSQTSKFSTISAGNPALYRPLYNTNTGQSGVEIVANSVVPSQVGVSGGFSSSLKSSFYGAEANLRSNFLCSQNFTVDGLVGFKTLGLNEDLILRESPALNNGSGFQIQDQFKTGNSFYGGQIGMIAEGRWNNWFLNGSAKLGMGVTDQTVQINGGTTAYSPTGPSIYYPAGIYAGSTNIGRYHREVFGVVPDIGISLGYQVTQHMRAYVGYDLIYWNSVLRPGQQIDQVINPNLVPGGPGGGPNRPGFTFNNSDFWAQGIKFGVEFRY